MAVEIVDLSINNWVFHSFVSLPKGKSEFKHPTIHATTPRIRSGMPCSKMCCTTKLALDSLFFGPDPKFPDKFLRFSRSLVDYPAKNHVDQHFLHQTIRTNHQEIAMSGCTNKHILHQFQVAKGCRARASRFAAPSKSSSKRKPICSCCSYCRIWMDMDTFPFLGTCPPVKKKGLLWKITTANESHR